MTCPADLHTHTTASDGQYTPSQLAAKALAAGIQILAVTDHDTMDGAEEAVRAGQACGLTVLRQGGRSGNTASPRFSAGRGWTCRWRRWRPSPAAEWSPAPTSPG